MSPCGSRADRSAVSGGALAGTGTLVLSQEQSAPWLVCDGAAVGPSPVSVAAEVADFTFLPLPQVQRDKAVLETWSRRERLSWQRQLCWLFMENRPQVVWWQWCTEERGKKAKKEGKPGSQGWDERFLADCFPAQTLLCTGCYCSPFLCLCPFLAIPLNVWCGAGLIQECFKIIGTGH